MGTAQHHQSQSGHTNTEHSSMVAAAHPSPPPCSQATPMADNHTPRAPTHADPQQAPSTDRESIHNESSEARLRRIRANLRLLDPPVALSADHDEGLRALGLLDFVRLGLSSSGAPRPDLVAELIANYNPSPNLGWSSVLGQRIEVSIDSFAEALCLPGKPTMSGRSGPASTVVTSAANEFMKVCILEPREASIGRKRRLPWRLVNALSSLKDLRALGIDWTQLIWYQVEEEMEHLIKKKGANRAYYGAYLQRLIWVERPDLFHLPPETPLADAAAQPAAPKSIHLLDPPVAPSAAHYEGLRALGLLDFVHLDLSSSGGPRPDHVAELIANYTSFPDPGWSSVRGQKIEVSIDSFAEAKQDRACYYGAYLQRLIWVQSQNLFQLPPEPPLVNAPPQPAALRPQKKRLRIRLPVNESQKVGSQASSEKIDVGLEKMNATSKVMIVDGASEKIDAALEKMNAASKVMIDGALEKIDAASKVMIDAASKMIEATSKQHETRAGEQDADMQEMQSLIHTLVTKERQSNGELQRARKMLIDVSEQLIPCFLGD